MSQIQDQLVKEAWFNPENTGQNDPALRIRIQYVYDEKQLLKTIVENCDEKIELIKETIRKIHDASHNSN